MLSLAFCLLADLASGNPQPVAEAERAQITAPAVMPRVNSGSGLLSDPEIIGRDPAALFKRDQVCGYLDADPNSPLYCSAGYSCGINTNVAIIDCCEDPASCPYHTACVPYEESADCDASCQNDVNILKCTDAYYGTECVTVEFIVSGYNSAFWHYGCESFSGEYTAYASPEASPTQTIASLTSPVALQESGSGSSGGGSGGSGNGNSGSGNGNSGSGNGDSYTCEGSGTCIIQKSGAEPGRSVFVLTMGGLTVVWAAWLYVIVVRVI